VLNVARLRSRPARPAELGLACVCTRASLPVGVEVRLPPTLIGVVCLALVAGRTGGGSSPISGDVEGREGRRLAETGGGLAWRMDMLGLTELRASFIWGDALVGALGGSVMGASGEDMLF